MRRVHKLSFFVRGRKGRQEAVIAEASNAPSSVASYEEDLGTAFKADRAKAERVLGTSVQTSSPKQSNLRTAQKPERSLSNAPLQDVNIDTSTIGIASSTSGKEYVVPAQPHPAVIHKTPTSPLGWDFPRDATPRDLPIKVDAKGTRNQDALSVHSVHDTRKDRQPSPHGSVPATVEDISRWHGSPTIVLPHAITSSTSLPIAHQGMSDTLHASGESIGRGPGKFDVSKLFSRPKTAGREASSSKPFDSASALTNDSSDLFQEKRSLSGKERREKAPKRPTRTLSKPKPPEHQPRLPVMADMFPDPSMNAKIHIRRPPPGIQHWFEALPDDDTETDSQREKAREAMVMQTNGGPGKVMLGNMNNTTLAQGPGDIGLKVSSSGRFAAVRGQELLGPCESTRGRRENSSRSGMSETTEMSTVNDSVFSGVNRQNASVLSLTSSDDEDDELRGEFQQAYIASTAQVREGSEIVTVRTPPRTRRTSGSRRRTSTEFSANYHTKDPDKPEFRSSIRASYLQLPHRHRSKAYPVRKSSFAREYETGPRSSSETLAGLNGAWLSSPSVKSSLSEMYNAQGDGILGGDKQKLMAVTDEEEALLEMMRRRRVTMAKHSFVEGYRLGTEQDKAFRQGKRRAAGGGSLRRRSPNFQTMETPYSPLFPRPPSSHRPETSSSTVSRNMAYADERDDATRDGDSSVASARDSSNGTTLPPGTYSLRRQVQADSASQASQPDVAAPSGSAAPSVSVAPSRSTSVSSTSRQRPDSYVRAYPYHLSLSPVPSFAAPDVYPSPTTGTLNSPRTPTFPSSMSEGPGVEVVGAETTESALLFDPGISGHHDRRRAPSSTMMDTDGDEDSASAGFSKKAKEDPEPLPAAKPYRSATTRSRGRAASREGPRPAMPSTRKGEKVTYGIPFGVRGSVGDDVLAAWGALGGWRDPESVSTE